LAETDAWMAAARAAGVEPLIAFNRNWRRGGDRHLPSVRAYLRSFRTFRVRYPGVAQFSAWNEANHPGQPTGRDPRAAARYYNALRSACPHCTLVAADVLDSSNLLRWLTTFKRYAANPRLWGLHNYSDANRGTSVRTRLMLRAVRGQVWLTETGGVVRIIPAPGSRGRRRRWTLAAQAAAVTRVFTLADLSSRIARIYFYQWKAERRSRWDSALLNADGTPRPALTALRRGLQR
jgi:Glycosyl hydrolase catalytic core